MRENKFRAVHAGTPHAAAAAAAAAAGVRFFPCRLPLPSTFKIMILEKKPVK